MNKRNKIVLLYPRLHFEKRHQSWNWFPLPIMAVGAPLLAEGYDVVLVNGDMEPDALKKVVDNCADALLLGISSMSGAQIHFGLEAARAVREAGHKLPIIWGGYHPSILPEQTSQNPYVDTVVRGQGERTVLEIAAKLSQGEDFTDVEGITFTRDGETVSNPSRKMEDIDNFPRLPYEKMENPEQYINNMPLYGSRTINYLSSQGCPFRCQFCAEPMVYERHWKVHSPERVLADLEFLHSLFKINGISFSDPNFFGNEKRAREIASGMVEKNLKFGWNACARASQIANFSDETFAALKAGGFKSFFVGAESGSNQMLQTMQKDIKSEDTIQAARVATENGIRISFSFIVGFPGESDKDVYESWDMIQQVSQIMGEYTAELFFFEPTPGHALYEKACQLGWKQPGSLEEWAKFSLFAHELPWMNKKFVNRMKQRQFYLTYGYPSEAVRTRAGRSSLNRTYARMAETISAARCRRQYWNMPIDWWLLQGLRQA